MTAGAVLALVYTAGWIPLFALRAESVHVSLPHYDTWRERASVILSVVAMSTHVTATCLTITFMKALPPVATAASLAIFAAGLGLWLWGRILISPLFTQRLPEEAPPVLQTGGAFGIVRHPLFLGMLVAAGAPLLVAPRIFLALTFVLCCLALALQAVQEEARLHAQLGEPYAAYCLEVKRLIPWVW